MRANEIFIGHMIRGINNNISTKIVSKGRNGWLIYTHTLSNVE
jgi:hypothetical protein